MLSTILFLLHKKLHKNKKSYSNFTKNNIVCGALRQNLHWTVTIKDPASGDDIHVSRSTVALVSKDELGFVCFFKSHVLVGIAPPFLTRNQGRSN